MKDKFFLLLQINDALFPIGGFTQSYGLETYIQKKIITNGDTTYEYLKKQLFTSFLYSELLSIKIAYSYAMDKKISQLVKLEQLSKASKSPKELRDASLKLGNRFIRAVNGIELDFDTSFLDEYCNTCKKIGTSHAISYGVFCAVAEIDLGEAIASYLYAQTSSNVTNCVKLIPLSQTVGQQVLYKLQGWFSELLVRLDSLSEDDLFLSCPALDIRSMQHEILYSRLYMS